MSRNVNYDCTLEYGSTTIPLMLVTEPTTKLKKFLSYYASPLGQSLQIGEASSANFPPEQELTIEQKEFHGGMGWISAFKNINNKVYAYSDGVDARVRGKLKLSPKEYTATISQLPALTTAAYANMDFETWSDATTLGSWNKVTSAMPVITNREATEVHDGTYSCNLIAACNQITDGGFETWIDENNLTNWVRTADIHRNTSHVRQGSYSVQVGANSTSSIYQDLTWDNYLKGKSITFTTYCWCSEASKARIAISDGIGTTYSDYHAGSAWEQLTVTRVLDANATKLRLECYSTPGVNVITCYDSESTVTSHIGDVYLYQDIASYLQIYDNKSATFTHYAKTSLASNIRLGIDDGVTITYGNYHTGGGAWENLTVTKTLAGTADKIRLIIQRNSDTYSTTDYVDTATFALAQSTRGNPLAPQCFITFGSTYYYLENKTIYALSGTTFTEVYTFEDAITGVDVYDSNMYVSVGADDYYYYTSDGTTWTRTSAAACKMIQLKAIGSTLYGADTTYSVKTSTDPYDTPTWSSNTTFGNASTAITDITEYNQTAFVGKSDNLYYLDSTGNPQSIAPDFKGLNSPYNCLGMKAWQGALWIPLNNGMYRYTYPLYHDLVNVSPESYMSALTDYHGRVHAIAGDLSWLYVAASSSTATSNKTPIMACRYETIQDTEVETDVRFHSLLNVDLDDVIAMDVYSSKLWIAGKKSTTAYIRYLSLANDDYPSTGTFYTSYYDSNFPSFYKAYHSLELQSENLTANVTVKVEFQIDGGTWTELGGTGTGTFTSSTAPQVKYFQTSTYGRKIRFRFTLSTNSGTTTPVITGFIVRGALRPDTLRVQEWWIDCSDDLTVNNGLTTRNTASKIKSDLETAKAQTWALTVYDPYGTTWYGFIKSPTPEIQGYEFSLGTGKDKRIKSVVHIILQEARLSA